MLHPQARALLDLMTERGVPPTHTLTPAEARAAYRDRRSFTQPAAPEVARVSEAAAEGPHGPIPLRVYRPLGAARDAALPATDEETDSAALDSRQFAQREGQPAILVQHLDHPAARIGPIPRSRWSRPSSGCANSARNSAIGCLSRISTTRPAIARTSAMISMS